MVEDTHGQETYARWGHTDAYRESRERMSKYSAEDIEMAKKQAAQAEILFLDAFNLGLPPESEQAALAAEAHRQAISDWWYECNYDMHVGLAEMYLADSRFKEHYERQQEGLAKYVHDSILANAIAHL